MTTWIHEISCLLTDWHHAAIYLYFILFSLAMASLWYRAQKGNYYSTSWYNPKEKGRSSGLEWEDVKTILRNDPVDYKEKFSRPPGHFIFIDALKIFAFAIVFVFIASRLPGWINNGDFLPEEANSETFIIYVLGVVTLFASIYIGFRQFSAKVKSESRKVWINEMRKLVAKALSSMAAVYSEKAANKDSRNLSLSNKNRDEGSRCIWQLELMINPKERDHRTLLTLLRILESEHSGYDYLDEKKQFQVDKPVFKNLGFLKKELDWGPGIDDHLNYAIRLSNAIFKREWERVKRGK